DQPVHPVEVDADGRLRRGRGGAAARRGLGRCRRRGRLGRRRSLFDFGGGLLGQRDQAGDAHLLRFGGGRRLRGGGLGGRRRRWFGSRFRRGLGGFGRGLSSADFAG